MGDADTEFVERYRPLVESIAHGLRTQLNPRWDQGDLVAFGIVGLLEARTRFDPSRGVQFSTFAYYRIRGAMIDGVARMSESSRALIRRLRAAEVIDAEAEHAAESRAGQPTQSARAALTSIRDIMNRAATAYAISVAPVPPPSPEQEVAERESIVAMRTVMQSLPERERVLIQRHYFEGVGLDVIGRDLGMSKSWMSRLHAKTLDRIRQMMVGDP